jgi:hypothetical protein
MRNCFVVLYDYKEQYPQINIFSTLEKAQEFVTNLVEEISPQDSSDLEFEFNESDMWKNQEDDFVFSNKEDYEIRICKMEIQE